MKNKFLAMLVVFGIMPVVGLALPDPQAGGAAGTDNFPKVAFGDWVNTVMTIIFVIIVFASIIFILYAAYLFATAQGESAQVDKAKTIIFWVVIGVITTALAYGLIQWVLKQFTITF